MTSFMRPWLLVAVGLASFLVVVDWLASFPYSRLVVCAAAGAVAAGALTRRGRLAGGPPSPATANLPRPPAVPPADLALALEHLQSIRVLLQVSAAHRQPVPPAVLINLDLVLKNLRKAASSHPAAPECGLRARTPARDSIPDGIPR